MRKGSTCGLFSGNVRVGSGRLRKMARLMLAVGPVAGAMFTFSSHAAAQTTYTWDPSQTGGSDGSGAWNTSGNSLGTSWFSGGSDVAWVNGATSFAVIGDNQTAGTITLGTAIVAGSLQFNATGTGDYLLTGSTLTTGFINVNYAGAPGTFNGPTINSVLGGTLGLSFTGDGGLGTLTIGGANTYTGGTFVTSGLLIVNSTTGLGAAANTLQMGPSAVQASGTAAATTSVGNLQLNANVSVGTLSVINDQQGATNTITVGSGDTLTVTGGIIVGEPQDGAAAQNSSLTVSGTGGTLNVTAGNIVVSPLAPTTNSNSATLNLANLNTFNFTNATGTLAIGAGTRAKGIMTLASAGALSSNQISVAAIYVGTSGSGNANTGSILNLGQGTNVLDANTIVIGQGKSQGAIQFAGTAGSVVIAGTAGGASTANLLMGDATSGSASSTTNGLFLAGHQATVQVGNVTLGLQAGNTVGSPSGTITFDTGSFNATSMILGIDSSGTATMSPSGTFVLGGTTTNTTATGILTIGTSTTPGTFVLGRAVNSSGTSVGNFTMYGGTANVFCNIFSTATGSQTNVSSTLNLDGGTLNMEGHAIGTGGDLPINTVNLASDSTAVATLMNLGGIGINATSNPNSATSGLNMNGSGTLLLAGTSSYSGITTLNGGTLQLTTGAGIPNSAVAPGGGVLAFSPGIGAFTIGGLSGNGGNAITLNDTAGAPVALTIGKLSGTFGGSLTGSGSLIVAGTNGTAGSEQFLTSQNSYTGNTTVSAGTLQLEGGSIYNNVTTTSSLTISGGTLGGQGSVNSGVSLTSGVINPDVGNSLNINSLTMSGGTLDFTLNGGSIGQLDVSGLASLNSGGLTFLLGAATPNAGTYTIIQANSLVNHLSLASQLVHGTSFQPVIIGSDLDIVVSGTPSNLLWIGANNAGVWDSNVTSNWNNQTTGQNPGTFHNADVVTFDDSAQRFTVNVSGQLQPSTVTFQNNNSAYLIMSSTGGGITGSTGVNLNGNGTVTISTVNSYTGDTDVNSGTLIVGSGGLINDTNANIFSGNAALTVASGGTLLSTNVNVNNGTFTVAATGTISAAENLGVTNGLINFNSSKAIATLNGNNNSTLIQSGTLTVSGGGTFGGIIINGGSAGSLNATGGTLVLTGSNTFSGTTTIGAGALLQVDNGNNSGSINPLSNVIDNGALAFGRNDNPTISNNVSGSGSVQQNGSGTITFSGNNTYLGGTAINNGAIIVNPGGSLGSSLAAVSVGTDGSVAAGGTKITTNVGALILNTNLTVGAFSSTSNNTNADGLTIGSGLTMTVNGPFTVGPADASASGTALSGALTAGGSGALIVSGSFLAGQPSNNTGGKNTTTVDLSGLSSFSVGAPGVPAAEFGVGFGANSHGLLTLANAASNTNAAPSNYVNVSQIDVGNTQSGNDAGAGVMVLGNGTNTLYADTINVGLGKTGGTITFNAANSTGSVVIGGANGVGASAITLGNASSASEGAGRFSELLLAGHQATVAASTLIVGENTNNSANEANGVLTFDTGTFSAQTVLIAADTGGSSTAGPTGNIVLGGSSPSTASEVFNVSGNVLLGDFTNTASTVAADTATGTLTINGGTMNVYGNISVPSTAGHTVATLTLAGNGVLNMEGNSIGGNGTTEVSGNEGVTASFAPNGGDSVTLENLGGAGVNGAGLSVNPGGTLILDGVNTYTGGTTIGGGVVQVGQATSVPLATPLGAASGTVTNGGNLAFASNNVMLIGNGITGNGQVTQNGAGVTTLSGTSSYTGQTTINAGTLSVEGALYNGVSPGTISINAGTLAGAGTTDADVTLNSSSATIMPDATGTALEVHSLTDNGGTLQFNVNGANIGEINSVGSANLSGGQLSFGVISAPTKGSYTILTSTGLSNSLSLSPFSAGRTTFTPSVSGNNLVVNVTGGPASLTWNNQVGGGDGTTWDVQNSQNWNSSASTNPHQFFQFDNVTFNDSNNGHYAVSLGTTVTPLSTSVSTTGTYVFSGSGSIAGSTGLSLSGGGTLSLGNTGTNTYTGTTAINSGKLQVAAPGALPNETPLTIGSTGFLDLDGNNATVGSLSGSGTIGNSAAGGSTFTYEGIGASTFNGTIEDGDGQTGLTVASGSLTLNGNSSFTGATTINSAASLIVAGNFASTSVNDGGALEFAANTTVATNISGIGELNQVGNGTLTLTGNNSYGVTNISAGGAVQVGGGGSAGSIGNGQINDAGALIINLSSSPRIANTITGSGALVVNGTGTVTLPTNSTYTGGTVLNHGELVVSGSTGSTALGSGAVSVNPGATLVGADADAFGYAPHVAPAVININGGTVTDLGTSAYQLDLPNVTFTGGTLTSAAGNTGGTDAATIGAIVNYAFVGDTTTATVTTNSASTTAVINAATISAGLGIIGAPTPTYAIPLTFNVAPGTTPSGVDLLVSSQILSPGGGFPLVLNKTGAGAMELTGSNSFTGSLTVSNGSLIIGAAGALPSGTNVTNGASFVVNAATTAGNITDPGTSGVTTVSSGASLAVSNITQLGGLANSGTTVINGSGTVGPITGKGSLSITAGSLQIAANNTGPLVGAPSISGTLGVGPSSQGSLILGTTSNLDLTNNSFVVNYAGGGDPIASIVSYLKAGYQVGWNGTAGAIFSSSVAALNASQSTSIYSIGYADGADGITRVPSGDIEILPTLAGDAKLTGNVVFGDFQLLAASFGLSASWDQGNFSYGSVVNFGDFQILAQNFGQSASGLTGSELSSLNSFAAGFGDKLVANPGGGFSVVAVPEPASVGLLAAAGLGLLSRRRRRK